MSNTSIAIAKLIIQVDDIYNSPDWDRDVIEYLRRGTLPKDKKEARKICTQYAWYTLINNVLYCRGYTLPLLKCLSKFEAEFVLKEIHEGVCGEHSEGWMLAYKTVRASYYWPTMNRDSSEMVKLCDKWQRFSKVD
jgi:hypothetical protein